MFNKKKKNKLNEKKTDDYNFESSKKNNENEKDEIDDEQENEKMKKKLMDEEVKKKFKKLKKKINFEFEIKNKTNKNNISPSPQDYNPKMIDKNITHMFSKSERLFFGEGKMENLSPGPIYFPKIDFLRKTYPKYTFGSKNKVFEKIIKSEIPKDSPKISSNYPEYFYSFKIKEKERDISLENLPRFARFLGRKFDEINCSTYSPGI
jgi:hypothetical protein